MTGGSQGYGSQGYGSQEFGGGGGRGWSGQEYGSEFGGSRSGSFGGGQGMGGYGGQQTFGESQRGQHWGRGPKNYRRADERIEEDVNEELTRHGAIDASDIEVKVKDGEVTLTGHVDSRRAKRLAEDIVEGLSGVREVNNQLRVRHHGESGAEGFAGSGSSGSSGGSSGGSSSGGTSGARRSTGGTSQSQT